VIVAFSTPAAQAAKAATSTVPIVFTTNRDPVQIGLVASLNRPGGNLTGSTNLGVEVGPKLLNLLHEAVPTAKIIALLVNPTNTETPSSSVQAAARTFGLQLHVLNASTDRDFDSVFAMLRQLRADGLVVVSDAFFATQSKQLAALTISHAIPAARPPPSQPRRRHAEATASSFLLAPAPRLGSLPTRRAGDFLRVQGHALAFGLRPADARREARDLEHLLGLGQRISPVEVNYRIG
jgi:hypothetical protein